MKTLVTNLDNHPVIAFLLFIAGIIGGHGIGLIHHDAIILSVTYARIAHAVLMGAQVFCYTGGGLAGFVSFHGWMKKQGYLPLKKRKK